jgi:diguanylate cyclase (GGDEF)-like protein
VTILGLSLQRRSESRALALATLAFLAVGACDLTWPTGLSISALYVLPVLAASWFAGPWAAMLLSVASALTWFAADLNRAELAASRTLVYGNSVVRLALFTAVALGVAALRKSLENARVDPLTGIGNALAFRERADAEWHRSRRYERPLTIVELAIDDFDSLVTRFGRSVGNAALRSLAGTLRGRLRATDFVARLDGHRFGMILAETGDEAASAAVGTLHAELLDAGRRAKWPVTFTMGAATFDRPPDDVETLLSAPGETLLLAQADGPGSVLHRSAPSPAPEPAEPSV